MRLLNDRVEWFVYLALDLVSVLIFHLDVAGAISFNVHVILP